MARTTWNHTVSHEALEHESFNSLHYTCTVSMQHAAPKRAAISCQITALTVCPDNQKQNLLDLNRQRRTSVKHVFASICKREFHMLCRLRNVKPQQCFKFTMTLTSVLECVDSPTKNQIPTRQMLSIAVMCPDSQSDLNWCANPKPGSRLQHLTRPICHDEELALHIHGSFCTC